MIPVLGGKLALDASQRRVSEYIAKLFAEGEFADVVAIAQKELESKPTNLDLVVYRACAILVLQVSGTMNKNEALVQQAISHLDMVSDLLHKADDTYDDSLDFYSALGYLVLEKFEKADQLLAFIAPQIADEEDTMAYYDARKAYWKAKRGIPPRPATRHFTFVS